MSRVLSFFSPLRVAVFSIVLLVIAAPLFTLGAIDDFVITLTSSSDTFLPGETLTVSVAMENNDNEALANGGYQFVIHSNAVTVDSTTLAGAVITTSGNQTLVTATGQNLPAGGTAAYDVTFTVPADFTATALRVDAEILKSSGNTEEDESMTINKRLPVLTLTKVAVPTVQPGATLTYTIIVRNLGFAPATGVVVTDAVPSPLTGFAAPNAPDCAEATGTITCGPFDLPVGEKRDIVMNFTVPVATACATVIENTAEVTATDVAAVAATATTTVCPAPSPSPTPTPSPSPTPTSTPQPTPTPTPTPTPATTSANGSSGGKSGGGGGGGGTNVTPPGRVLGLKTGISAADRKAPDFIPNQQVPAVVSILFQQVYGRPITHPESLYWKARARNDKATVSKLRGAMQWHKLRGTSPTLGASSSRRSGGVTVSSLFQQVYGRSPRPSELAYWNGRRASKPTVAALSGAMAWHRDRGVQH